MTVVELSGLLIVIVLGAMVLGSGDGDLGRVLQFPEVLRREQVDHDHFRTPVVLPVLALASCLLLPTRQEGGVWVWRLLLLGLGVLLQAVTAAVRRRRPVAARKISRSGGRSAAAAGCWTRRTPSSAPSSPPRSWG